MRKRRYYEEETEKYRKKIKKTKSSFNNCGI